MNTIKIYTVRDLVSNPEINHLSHVKTHVQKKAIDVAVAKYEIKKWTSLKPNPLPRSHYLVRKLNQKCIITSDQVQIISTSSKAIQ